MIVYNGDIPVLVGHESFDMESLKHDRIILPYKGTIWGDLLNTIEDLVLNSIPDMLDCDTPLHYNQIVDRETVSFSFNVQRTQIRVMAIVDAVSPNGHKVNGRVRLASCAEEVYDILHYFFERGAVGLDPRFAEHYQNVFEEWLKNNNVK